MSSNSLDFIPDSYTPYFNKIEAAKAIKLVKDNFSKNIENELNLVCVTAPLFVESDSGINDNLSGVERPVEFDIKNTGKKLQIVHSLAKWKRIALKNYDFKPGEGLYTDMIAIRRDEDLDNIHSAYVDQWDWERVITPEERNIDMLKFIVRGILKSLKLTEEALNKAFPEKKIPLTVPDDIFFITTQELEDMYPDQNPKQRENLIAKKYGAVFLMQIGDVLKSGIKHGDRSPDYDDWKLNGDIILWYEPLQMGLELSSMGIRVNKESLLAQLKLANEQKKEKLKYHSMLLNGELPLTIGGGIGQSRVSMYLMKTVHIGEVQSSFWPKDMVERYKKKGIEFL